MNIFSTDSTSPKALVNCFRRNYELIKQMTSRDVMGRYKGSIIGLGWSLFNPLLMLLVYTFIFSVVFKSRWANSVTETKTDFAIIMFVGMLVHTLFAEVLNRAPNLIVSNVNFVKKVIFPLEILPIVVMGAALFQCGISLLVLLAVFAFFNGFLYWTVLLIPLTIMPLLFVTAGFAWFLASLGAYIRDVGQTVSILTTVMLFFAPVFYPSSALPEQYRILLLLNPLTFIIEQSRQVLVFGNYPDWIGLIEYSCVGLLIAWLGFFWFQKTRKGFADVI